MVATFEPRLKDIRAHMIDSGEHSKDRRVRFHIDAKKYREWGMSGAHGGFGCTAVLTEGPMPFPMDPPPAVAAAPAATDPLAPHN